MSERPELKRWQRLTGVKSPYVTLPELLEMIGAVIVVGAIVGLAIDLIRLLA